MPQALTLFATMFPSLPASTIVEALGKTGGDIQLTAEALLETSQVSAWFEPQVSCSAPQGWLPIIKGVLARSRVQHRTSEY